MELIAPCLACGCLLLRLHVPQGAAYGVKVGNSLQQNQAISVQAQGAQLAQVFGLGAALSGNRAYLP